MDSNLVIAVVTSICTSASVAAIAIATLILWHKRITRVEKRLSAVEERAPRGTGDVK